MIKRTILLSRPAYLSTRKEQLLIKMSESEEEAAVTIEDIGVVVMENPQITISHRLISLLLANNVALITCDSRHMPQGLMLNLEGHDVQQEHFRVQIEADKAIKDLLWQQTVKAKILNQALLLDTLAVDTFKMKRWAGKVAPGDPDNFEARAAAYYWDHVFGDHHPDFRRGRYGGPPNNLLNYGYAILRAVTARSLVASGLMPTLGYFHRNRYNAYALADDLMEPYRPFVDQIVLEILHSTDEYEELSKELKAVLLQLPVVDVLINKKRSPLMIAMQQSSSSLYKCLAGELKQIRFPKLCLPSIV